MCRCESCFKGTAVHDIHGVSFLMTGRYCCCIVHPKHPCILIMGLYSVLFITATAFIYGSLWLAKFNLKCKMQNGNAIFKMAMY